jgi:SMI1/KNR4 family protein SUKH-1
VKGRNYRTEGTEVTEGGNWVGVRALVNGAASVRDATFQRHSLIPFALASAGCDCDSRTRTADLKERQNGKTQLARFRTKGTVRFGKRLLCMTQDEFDDLIQEIREEDPEQLDSEFFVRDKPLKEDKVAKLEQKAGFTLPEEYRNFLKRFGAGDIGTITVLSLDPESDFSLWKNQEPFEKVNWIPVVDDGKSNFYGLVVENGACSREIWFADQDLGYELSGTDYEDFYQLIATEAFGVDT